MASGDEELLEKRDPVKSGWISTTYNCFWEKFERPGMMALYTWKFDTNNDSNIPKNEKVSAFPNGPYTQ